MVFSCCRLDYFGAEELGLWEVFAPDVKVVFLHLNEYYNIDKKDQQQRAQLEESPSFCPDFSF